MDNTQNPLSGLPNSLPQIPLPPASSPLPVSNGSAPAMVPPTPTDEGGKRKKKVPLKMVIGGVVAALVVAVVGVVASQLNKGGNIADTRSRANCSAWTVNCGGGRCYQESNCTTQQTFEGTYPGAGRSNWESQACASSAPGNWDCGGGGASSSSGGGGGGPDANVCHPTSDDVNIVHPACKGVTNGGGANYQNIPGTCTKTTTATDGWARCAWAPTSCVANGSPKGSGMCCSGVQNGDGVCISPSGCTTSGQPKGSGYCCQGVTSITCSGGTVYCGTCPAPTSAPSTSSTGVGGGSSSSGSLPSCSTVGTDCQLYDGTGRTHCTAANGINMYCKATSVLCSTVGTSCLGTSATGATACTNSSGGTMYCCPTGQQVSSDNGTWSCKIDSSADGIGGCCVVGAADGTPIGCQSSTALGGGRVSTCTVDNGACATGKSCTDVSGSCNGAATSADCVNKFGGGVCKWTAGAGIQCTEDPNSTSCLKPSYQASDAACPSTCSWTGSACINKIPNGTAGCCANSTQCPSGQTCTHANGTCTSGLSCDAPVTDCNAAGVALGTACTVNGVAGNCRAVGSGSTAKYCQTSLSSSSSSAGTTCPRTQAQGPIAGCNAWYACVNKYYAANTPICTACGSTHPECLAQQYICKNPSSNPNCNGKDTRNGNIGPCTCTFNGGAGNDCSCYVNQGSSSSASTGGSCTGNTCVPGAGSCCAGHICSLNPGQGYVCNVSDKNAYCGAGSVCGGSQGYIAFRCTSLAPSATSNGVPVCEGGNNQTFDTWAAAKAWVDQTGCGQVDEVCVNGAKNRQQCGDFLIVADRCGGGSSSSTPPGSSSSSGPVGACVETRIYVGDSSATMATTATPVSQLGTAVRVGKTIRMAVRGNATTFNAGRFIVKRDGQVLGTFDVTQSRALPGDPAGKEYYYDYPITVAGAYVIQGFVNETPPSVTATPQPTLGSCNRCSVYYDNQRTQWSAADCNASPTSSTVITRTYDAACGAAPAATRVDQCARCSTVNTGEYVWWTPESGKTCADSPSSGVTVYRAPKADCTTGPWSGYPINTSTWDTVFAYTQPGGADRGQIYNGNRYWGWMCQNGVCNAALTADTTVSFGSYTAANPDFALPTSGYDAIMGFMRKDNILRVNFFKGTNYYQADCTFVDANTPTVTGCAKTTTNTISGWKSNITDTGGVWTANPLPDGNFDAAAQWIEPPGTKIRVNIYKGDRYWAYRCDRDATSGGGVNCNAVTTANLAATASITDSSTVWANNPLPTSGWDDVTVKMISPTVLRASVFIKGTNGNPGRYWGYECTYQDAQSQQIASCKAVITRSMKESMLSVNNSNILGASTTRQPNWLESFLTKLRGVIVK